MSDAPFNLGAGRRPAASKLPGEVELAPAGRAPVQDELRAATVVKPSVGREPTRRDAGLTGRSPPNALQASAEPTRRASLPATEVRLSTPATEPAGKHPSGAGPRLGRKQQPRGTTSHRTSISLSAETRAKLEALAAGWGMSLSGTIDRLVREQSAAAGSDRAADVPETMRAIIAAVEAVFRGRAGAVGRDGSFERQK